MSENDVERLGDYRSPAGEPPDEFVVLWQAADHLSSGIDALTAAVEAVFEDDEMLVSAPQGDIVEVDLEAERQKIRDYLDRLRERLDAIEELTRAYGTQ